MGIANYNICSTEDIVHAFVRMSVQEVQEEIIKLSPERLIPVAAAMHHDKDPSWRPKIKAIFTILANKDQLEAFGKALHYPQMLEVLETAKDLEAIHHWKLLPILVGLPNQVFEEVLQSGSLQQLQVLKQEAITEPIQHHLTVMLHGIAHDIESRSSMLHNLLKEISSIDVSKVNRGSIDSIKTMLASLSAFYLEASVKISKALALAWNTYRADLIEKMTTLKDSCLKYNAVVIGHPHSNEAISSGFYALLDKQLDTVYGKLGDPEDNEALDNSEPAIEGLSKLGVWYMHDYWEIGLLPGIKEPDLIEQEGYATGDSEQSKDREKLYFLTLENLERLGLTTVGDLKSADIYSKGMLIDYINEHHNKLKK